MYYLFIRKCFDPNLFSLFLITEIITFHHVSMYFNNKIPLYPCLYGTLLHQDNTALPTSNIQNIDEMFFFISNATVGTLFVIMAMIFASLASKFEKSLVIIATSTIGSYVALTGTLLIIYNMVPRSPTHSRAPPLPFS